MPHRSSQIDFEEKKEKLLTLRTKILFGLFLADALTPDWFPILKIIGPIDEFLESGIIFISLAYDYAPWLRNQPWWKILFWAGGILLGLLVIIFIGVFISITLLYGLFENMWERILESFGDFVFALPAREQFKS